MAKEFKTLNVTTENEERTIRAFQSFGWTLKNNQEIYVKDSHTETWGNQRYSITETTHYVKLSFERDGSKLKYYQQIRQLEDMFWSVQEPKKPDEKKRKLFIIMWMLFGFFAFFMFIIPTSATKASGCVFAIICALFAYLHYRYNQNYKAWQDAYRKCWNKREKIMAKAEPYLE